MKSQNVLLFYIFTFISCWGIAALFIIIPEPLEAAFGPMDMYNPVFILYAYIPSIIALTLSFILEGRVGLRAWFDRYTRWKVETKWYILILLGLPAMAYLAALFSGQVLSFDFQVLLLAIFPGVLVGPLSEEPGWHGYALPNLLKNNNLLKSGLIAGFLWAIWHLPAYVLSGTPQESRNPAEAFAGFVMVAIGLNLLQAWIFSRTGGSALVAGIFCHLAYNISMELAGDPHLWMGILLLVSAIITAFVDRTCFLSPRPNLEAN
jgi:membrane protease YdiL (CAAX protease family)